MGTSALKRFQDHVGGTTAKPAILHQFFHPELEAAVVSTLENKSLFSSELGGRLYTQFNPRLLLDSKPIFPSHTTGSYWLWLGTGRISCNVISWMYIPRFVGEFFPCVTELAKYVKEFHFVLPFIARGRADPRPHVERGVPRPSSLTSDQTGLC